MQVIDELLVQGPAHLEGPLYPMAVSGPAASAADPDPSTASDVQISVAIVACVGIPANTDGVDGQWALSDNGHQYFKAVGAWTQKV